MAAITQKSLYEKYQFDLAKLQKRCKHKEVSDWMIECWAPGHSTGHEVQVCLICNVKVKSRGQIIGDWQITTTTSNV